MSTDSIDWIFDSSREGTIPKGEGSWWRLIVKYRVLGAIFACLASIAVVVTTVIRPQSVPVEYVLAGVMGVLILLFCLFLVRMTYRCAIRRRRNRNLDRAAKCLTKDDYSKVTRGMPGWGGTKNGTTETIGTNGDMMDCCNIDRKIGRVVASLVGLLLLVAIGCRICRWWAGSSVYKTFLSAIAGRPFVRGRGSWDYGLWELCPDGQLAGVATIVLVVALLGSAIMNRSSLYCVAGGVIACGYLVNAYLFLKLMAAY